MRRVFVVIMLILIISCSFCATAEKISYSDAIQYEYRESDKNDRMMYGYDGVWFVSPSSGIELYVPGDWLETRLIKDYRDDFISYVTNSYDNRYQVYLRVDYTSEKNAAERMQYMVSHNWYSNHELIPFGNIELIVYTNDKSSYDWNTCIEHIPGNGFAYSLFISGSKYETLEEQEIIENIINSYTIRFPNN